MNGCQEVLVEESTNASEWVLVGTRALMSVLVYSEKICVSTYSADLRALMLWSAHEVTIFDYAVSFIITPSLGRLALLGRQVTALQIPEE